MSVTTAGTIGDQDNGPSSFAESATVSQHNEHYVYSIAAYFKDINDNLVIADMAAEEKYWFT